MVVLTKYTHRGLNNRKLFFHSLELEVEGQGASRVVLSLASM